MNLSPVSFHEIYKAIKGKGIKMIIEGHGNDESIGGYPVYLKRLIKDKLWKHEYKDAIQISRAYSSMKNEYVGQIRTNWVISLLLNSMPYMDDINKVFYLLKEKKKGIWDRELFHNTVHVHNPENMTKFNQVIFNSFDRTVLPTVLRVFDRATMSQSIEMRAPFLDFRLIQYIFSVPDMDKIGNGKSKKILRDSMQNLLPDFILNNKVKKGFSGNLLVWFNNNENLRFIEQHIFTLINSNIPINKKKLLKYFSMLKGVGISWSEAVYLSKIISIIITWELFVNKKFLEFPIEESN